MRGVPFELYDIDNDSNELNNLITVDTEISESLTNDLFQWRKSEKANIGVVTTKGVGLDNLTKEALRSLGYLR